MSQIEIIIMPVNHHQPPDEHQRFLDFGIPQCFSATLLPDQTLSEYMRSSANIKHTLITLCV